MFASVFAKPVFAAPTPEVTPEIGTLSSPGQAFGVLTRSNEAVDESVQVSRAWSIAINWFQALAEGQGNHLDQQQQQAFEYLIARQHDGDLLQAWYMSVIASSFDRARENYAALTQSWIIGHERPCLNPLISESIQLILAELQRCLSIANTSTDGLQPVRLLAGLRKLAGKVEKRWTAMVLSLSFCGKIEGAMIEGLTTALVMSSQQHDSGQCGFEEECECSVNLNILPLQYLRMIGLGGALAETALAKSLRDFLSGTAVHRRCFRVDWQGRTSCIPRLRLWINTQLAPVIRSALQQLAPGNLDIDWRQSGELIAAAVSALGRSRIDDLFDYIKTWPHSEGAIEDIKAILTDDQVIHKLFLCNSCEEQLQRRLLHIGASTSEILEFYVNLIHVFDKLDARGVLLEKVSPQLRQYLRTRSDVSNVIACSLLADPNTATQAGSSNVCRSIAVELDNAVQDNAQRTVSLDWDDMSWMPEPIDAAPGHGHHAKGKDVLSYVLSLYQQDDLVKEIESVLAEQLFKSKDPEIVRETRLLEALKSRLDSVKLQNVEVMLKDVRDSIAFEKRLRSDSSPTTVPTPKEVQAAIPSQGIGIGDLYKRFEWRMRRTQFQAVLRLVAIKKNDMVFPKRGRLPPEPQHADKEEEEYDNNGGTGLQVRVLSSSAWPQMRTSAFILPPSLDQALQHAEARFNALSGQRRLQWRPALALMSVQLELGDRAVSEDNLPAWYGAVIHAFGESVLQELSKSSLTLADLVAILQMDENLVEEALSFWMRKRVLYAAAAGEYAVLERLDMDTNIVHHTTHLSDFDNFKSALRSQDAVLREQAATFETFIANMLRNAGPKEVGGIMGITNMMKMVLPTFTYGDDEVLWLLNQMLGRGEVVKDGDSWKAT